MLAAGLDDRKLSTTHPSLARQLMSALDKLHTRAWGCAGEVGGGG